MNMNDVKTRSPLDSFFQQLLQQQHKQLKIMRMAYEMIEKFNLINLLPNVFHSFHRCSQMQLDLFNVLQSASKKRCIATVCMWFNEQIDPLESLTIDLSSKYSTFSFLIDNILPMNEIQKLRCIWLNVIEWPSSFFQTFEQIIKLMRRESKIMKLYQQQKQEQKRRHKRKAHKKLQISDFPYKLSKWHCTAAVYSGVLQTYIKLKKTNEKVSDNFHQIKVRCHYLNNYRLEKYDVRLPTTLIAPSDGSEVSCRCHGNYHQSFYDSMYFHKRNWNDFFSCHSEKTKESLLYSYSCHVQSPSNTHRIDETSNKFISFLQNDNELLYDLYVRQFNGKNRRRLLVFSNRILILVIPLKRLSSNHLHTIIENRDIEHVSMDKRKVFKLFLKNDLTYEMEIFSDNSVYRSEKNEGLKTDLFNHFLQIISQERKRKISDFVVDHEMEKIRTRSVALKKFPDSSNDCTYSYVCGGEHGEKMIPISMSHQETRRSDGRMLDDYHIHSENGTLKSEKDLTIFFKLEKEIRAPITQLDTLSIGRGNLCDEQHAIIRQNSSGSSAYHSTNSDDILSSKISNESQSNKLSELNTTNDVDYQFDEKLENKEEIVQTGIYTDIDDNFEMNKMNGSQLKRQRQCYHDSNDYLCSIPIENKVSHVEYEYTDTSALISDMDHCMKQKSNDHEKKIDLDEMRRRSWSQHLSSTTHSLKQQQQQQQNIVHHYQYEPENREEEMTSNEGEKKEEKTTRTNKRKEEKIRFSLSENQNSYECPPIVSNEGSGLKKTKSSSLTRIRNPNLYLSTNFLKNIQNRLINTNDGGGEEEVEGVENKSSTVQSTLPPAGSKLTSSYVTIKNSATVKPKLIANSVTNITSLHHSNQTNQNEVKLKETRTSSIKSFIKSGARRLRTGSLGSSKNRCSSNDNHHLHHHHQPNDHNLRNVNEKNNSRTSLFDLELDFSFKQSDHHQSGRNGESSIDNISIDKIDNEFKSQRYDIDQQQQQPFLKKLFHRHQKSHDDDSLIITNRNSITEQSSTSPPSHAHDHTTPTNHEHQNNNTDFYNLINKIDISKLQNNQSLTTELSNLSKVIMVLQMKTSQMVK
ncbi:hypothetical protein SNEBB_000779 [Seison nebaliae]|nr:hypothetical protein SNEBB_000779 [Seison nebaliae]